MVSKEQDADGVCSRAKEYLKGNIRDRKYKLPAFGLELSGDLLVRRVNTRTRGSSNEEDLVQVVIPEKLIPVVLKIVHEMMGGNHMGIERTYGEARKKYFWKGMYSDVERFVKNCRVCNEYKSSSSLSSKIATYPLPSRPFERVHLDLLTNFSESSRGNRHLLVMIDGLTRYVELYPIRSKTAEEVAIGFFNGFVCRHGVPEILVSDNGREFVNKIFDKLAELMKIRKVNIQPYRPEANGVCERANRKVLEALRVTVGGQDPNWDEYLDYVRFSINSNFSDSIKMSPHRALYGVEMRNPFDFFNYGKVDEVSVDTLMRTVHERFSTLRSNLGDSTEKMKEKVNSQQSTREIDVGDKVYMKLRVRNQLNYRLGPKFEGPFEVTERLVGNKFKLRGLDDDEIRVVHVSQLKLINDKKTKRVRFLL